VTPVDAYWTIGLTIAAGVVSIELYDWTGRFAEKVIPMAARLWTRDPAWREIYAEAWLADLKDCPGKLWRLVTATSFFARGLVRWLTYATVAGVQRARKRLEWTNRRIDSIIVGLRIVQLIAAGGGAFLTGSMVWPISVRWAVAGGVGVLLVLVGFIRLADLFFGWSARRAAQRRRARGPS
jgi:sterol desaturase/sphingolipid hydroxylase (fatty acid hydroxylase superfamily)